MACTTACWDASLACLACARAPLAWRSARMSRESSISGGRERAKACWHHTRCSVSAQRAAVSGWSAGRPSGKPLSASTHA
eukprot:48018-Lingulodinium_polyedra.AAC.1